MGLRIKLRNLRPRRKSDGDIDDDAGHNVDVGWDGHWWLMSTKRVKRKRTRRIVDVKVG